jgi:hypothetical protein
MQPDEAVAALAADQPGISRPSRQEYLSTGSLVLDNAMGGYPVGGVTEITGDPMSGKTTLAYLAVKSMQEREEGPVLLIDRDGFSPVRAALAGIDVDYLIVAGGNFPPNRLGPIRHVVVDGAGLLLGGWHPKGVTVVATSWRYRTAKCLGDWSLPWLDLTKAGKHAPTVAEIRTSRSPEVKRVELPMAHGALSRELELLALADQAGIIRRSPNGTHWYLQAYLEIYLGSGREAAARKLAKLPDIDIEQWVRRILTSR